MIEFPQNEWVKFFFFLVVPVPWLIILISTINKERRKAKQPQPIAPGFPVTAVEVRSNHEKDEIEFLIQVQGAWFLASSVPYPLTGCGVVSRITSSCMFRRDPEETR